MILLNPRTIEETPDYWRLYPGILLARGYFETLFNIEHVDSARQLRRLPSPPWHRVRGSQINYYSEF